MPLRCAGTPNVADGAGCGSGGSAAERWAAADGRLGMDAEEADKDEAEAVEEAAADEGDASFASAGAKSKLLLCGSGFGGDTHGTCTESDTRFDDGDGAGSGISGGSSCIDGWSSL